MGASGPIRAVYIHYGAWPTSAGWPSNLKIYCMHQVNNLVALNHMGLYYEGLAKGTHSIGMLGMSPSPPRYSLHYAGPLSYLLSFCSCCPIVIALGLLLISVVLSISVVEFPCLWSSNSLWFACLGSWGSLLPDSTPSAQSLCFVASLFTRHCCFPISALSVKLLLPNLFAIAARLFLDWAHSTIVCLFCDLFKWASILLSHPFLSVFPIVWSQIGHTLSLLMQISLCEP